MNENRQKALEAALSQIEKQFGKGSIMLLGEQDVNPDLKVVSTGSLGLDIALGIGGLPRGRVVEVYGPESSGKTTLTLSVIAEMQKIGGSAAFIDAEHALDPEYATKLGVNIDDLARPGLHLTAWSVGLVREGDDLSHLLPVQEFVRHLGACCLPFGTLVFE